MSFSNENHLQSITKRNVFVYIHPLTHLLGIAGPCQVFWEANSLIPDLYKMHFVSVNESVKSAQGLNLSELVLIENTNPNAQDIILIPGVDLNAFINRNPTIEEIKGLKWLREQNKKKMLICSIGSGSLILAQSGILNNRKCTSHWKCYDHFNEKYPSVYFIKNKIFLKDDNILTSAGMTSNIDTILSFVEDHHGPVFVSKLAAELLIFIRRFGAESQKSYYLDYKTHDNPLIHQAQNIIGSNLKENFTNAKLAQLLNTSERNLTRLFKNTLGISISEFKNNLRLELAQHLIHNKSLSVSQIAAECGFTDPRQLRRIWKKHFGGNISAIKQK